MKSYGICPASCGEFVQGMIKEKEYLSSYAINRFSKVTLEEKIDNANRGPLKSRKAIEEVFKYFDLPKEDLKNISIDIKSDIPISKGMASSTADIGATIKATLNLIGKDLNEYDICKLATKIEPTDSIYIKENTIFNPLNANIIKKLGCFDSGKVLILEPNDTLNTKHIRKKENYIKLKKQNKYIIEYAFKLLEQGIRKNDLNLIGQACNISSVANENIHKKKYLSEIMDISKEYGACGVNIAHSGTVIGILLEQDMDETKIIEKIVEKKINKKYKKIYTANIIAGGLRSE
ncbi:cobalamin biosynthesis protein [Paraclostridium ghonii]|uniref:GHMP family kinase ATP-binding protein n=1 Tax=Paraclostridium ghonii TaxID=29358 RepID=UPI00202CBEEE|nr:cobalamin biosynthesis protein [Paeniclostridium ghonii]MCM0165960.1 cobalamin biosynthesis protein [Paeniclostridium ghonii]